MTIFRSYRALNRFRKFSVIRRTAHGVCLLLHLRQRVVVIRRTAHGVCLLLHLGKGSCDGYCGTECGESFERGQG